MSIKKSKPADLSSRIQAIAGSSKRDADPSAATSPSSSAGGAKAYRRKTLRKETFKRGILVLQTGETLEVVIKNISEAGARVDFYQRATVSGDLILREPSLGLNKRARIVWRNERSAGLKFESD